MTYDLIENNSKYIAYGAVKAGDIGMLEWIMSLGCAFSHLTCIKAAKAGQLDVIKWLASKMDSWSEDFSTEPFNLRVAMCAEAAAKGHLHILEWMQQHTPAKIDRKVLEKAASNGHLHILKWLHQRNPLKKSLKQVCAKAAKGGHMEIVLWAVSNGVKLSSKYLAKAASGGQIDIIRYLKDQGLKWDNTACTEAANNGRLETLKWAVAEGATLTHETCIRAAAGGHLDILKWLWENKLPWNAHWLEFYPAKNKNYLEALKWAKSIGTSLQNVTCEEEIEDLETLQYLRENDCEWSDKLLSELAKTGNVKALKWAIDNGCPWKHRRNCDSENLWNMAGAGGNIEVIKLLADIEKPNYTMWYNIGTFAASYGHVDALKYVFKNQSVCLYDLIENAQLGRETGIPVYNWLLKFQ